MSLPKLVLVIDDEEDIREILKDTLNEEGYFVVCASDGKVALNILDCNDVDMIISDVNMPNMDGIDFIIEMKQRKSNTPVLAISGEKKEDKLSSSLRNIEKYAKVPVLEKPFDFDILIKTVEECIKA